jgi:hypothetical protein
MYDEKTNSMIKAQQASVGMVADLLLTAERELGAFYGAIAGRYGSEEARKAAHDWIEEVETMDWPTEGTIPNWRHVSIVAANCLASRVIQRSLNP